jgi:hypothetical protein
VVRVGEREGGFAVHAQRWITVIDVGTLRTLREWSYRPGDQVLIGNGEKTTFEAEGSGGTTGACAVAPDNRTVAVASDDSPRIRFFDLRSGTELRRVGGHSAAVVALRRSGSKLISVGSEHVARAWEFPAPAVRPLARTAGRELELFEHWDGQDLPPRRTARFKVIYDPEHNRIQARDGETEAVVWERDVPQMRMPAADRPRYLPIFEDPDWDRVAFAAGDTMTVCDLQTGEQLAEARTPGCWATAIEFGRDPDTLAVGYHDGQILLWDLWPPNLPRRPPTEAEFAALWADLGGSPRAAAKTRSAFLDDPAVTLRWLDAHLWPLERPTDYDIDLWLAKLAHPRYGEREEATRQLVRHLDVAGPAVTGLLAATKSPEVEHRLRMVIDRHANLGGDGEVVRLVRAVAILERIDSADARKLLLRLARGGGIPAERAKAALRRLTAGKSADNPPAPTAR